jgi:hypothetical protein
MPEGNTPEQNTDDKGFMGKASEFFRNLAGKGGEGSGLKGDPEAEAQLAEAREASQSDVAAIQAERAAVVDATAGENMVVPKPADNLVEFPQPKSTESVQDQEATVEAPDELDKAA